MNKPLTQKEKLAKRVKELNVKVGHLELVLNPDEDFITHKSDVDFSLCYEALIHLPNRILAKVIREAKATIKELEEEKKNMEEE